MEPDEKASSKEGEHSDTSPSEPPAESNRQKVTSLCEPVDFFLWDGNSPPPQEVSLPAPLTPYASNLPIPPTVRPSESGHLKMFMVPATAQLHPELSNPTNVWVYRIAESAPQEPQVPVGPTIEVRQGQRVHVEWKNALVGEGGQAAKHPVVAVHDLPAYIKFKNNGQVHAAENLPGFTLGEHDHSAARLPPRTVVHLHGGRTEANSDGWPENMIYPGQVQSDTYDNRQPGTLLWYHDHGMSITRLNVYAGLAGFYLTAATKRTSIRGRGTSRSTLPTGAGRIQSASTRGR